MEYTVGECEDSWRMSLLRSVVELLVHVRSINGDCGVDA